MKPGQIIKKFVSKKGNEIIIRVIDKNDSKGIMNLLNSVIAEDDFIDLNKKLPILRVRQRTKEQINALKENKEIRVVVLCGKKIIGNSSLKRGIGTSNHVAHFGINLIKDYRSEGIGTSLMQEMIKLVKREFSTTIMELEVYATNRVAIKLYNKLGFKKAGIVVKGFKRKGKFIDKLIMYKEL